MAGSTLAYPLNGAANWEAFPDIVQKIQAGYMRLGLTNMGNSNEPQIAAGSTLDVNGTCCVFSSAESITGWSGISNDTDVYIKVVVSGSSVTAQFTTDAPTWSDAKQGWYDGNDRYVGGLYKDGSGNYAIKWLYPPTNDPVNQEMIRDGETRPLLEKTMEIGDWDMDTDLSVNIAHGIPGLSWKLRNAAAVVRYDSGGTAFLLFVPFAGSTTTTEGGCPGVTDTYITLSRLTGGSHYDGGFFSSTGFNRGWVIIKYRA